MEGWMGSSRLIWMCFCSSTRRIRSAAGGQVVHVHVQPGAEYGHVQHAWLAFQGAHGSQQIGSFELQQLVRVQIPLERVRHAQGDQLAAINQRQAMAVFRFVHVVRGDQNGMAGFGKLIDQVPEAAARDGIDARSGLVQKQDARGMHDGAAQRQALLPAAGQQLGDGGAAVGEARHAQHVLLAFRAHVFGDAVNPAEEVDVLFHGEIVVERELLRHVADVLADLFGILGDVEAGHGAPAGGGRQQPAEHADDGGFAGAVGTQETEDLALVHLEGDVIDGHEIAEGLDQVADFEGGAV